MRSTHRCGRFVVLAALLLLAVVGAASAQIQTGNLYGTVTDDKGAELSGVTVTLTGSGSPLTTTTSPQGKFNFKSLQAGTYDLKTTLEGFTTVDYPNVVINIGRNTQLEVKMSPAVEGGKTAH